MLAVALETSTRRPSVAVSAAGRTSAHELDGARPHASDLLPALDRLVAAAGAAPRDIDLVCCGIGPGSYTGLRVGIATAIGIARAADASLIALPSGDALAWSELAPGGRLIHLIDARAGALYFAELERTADDVLSRTAVRVVRPEELAGELAGELAALLAPDIPICADAAAADAADLDADARARMLPDRRPHAAALLELGLRRHGRGISHDRDAVEPLYLRAFGA